MSGIRAASPSMRRLDAITLTRANDEIPVVDWDMADICYATSKDGFDWVEQGVAVPRAPKGTYGDRSLSTPDILVWGGRYYLYYQCFTTMWRANDCVGVSMAHADSPDGPWTRVDEPVVPQGALGEWDSWRHPRPISAGVQGAGLGLLQGFAGGKDQRWTAARARRRHRRPAGGSLRQIAFEPRDQLRARDHVLALEGRHRHLAHPGWGRRRTPFNSRPMDSILSRCRMCSYRRLRRAHSARIPLRTTAMGVASPGV